MKHIAVEIDVDEGRRRSKAPAACPDFSKPAADGQHDVALASNGPHKRRGGSAKTVPQPQRVVFRKHALALDRRCDRRTELLCDRDQRVPRVTGAVADIEQRAGRAIQQPGCLCDRVGIEGSRVLEAAVRGLRRVMGQQVEVRRNFHGDRAWRPAPGQVKGSPDDGIDLVGRRRRQTGLGHGSEQGQLIDVVQLIRPARVGADPAGEDHHGNPVQKRFCHTGQALGDAGARHDIDYAHARRSPRHAIGHEPGALFVGDQHRDHVSRPFKRVVQLNVVSAGNPERESSPRIFQRPHDQLGSPYLHDGSARSSGRCRRTPSATRSANAMMVT
jgi:hypothetical protein